MQTQVAQTAKKKLISKRTGKEVKTTLTGYPIKEIPLTLPYQTQSLCPECLKVVPARKFEEEGQVFMDKTCPDHGYFKELISPDVEIYMTMFTRRFHEGEGVSNPIVPDGKHCPSDCGICNMHHSHTALANIDLTNRCDMTCPVCFANANAQGYVTEPELEELRMMMKNLRDMKPVPAKVLQFAGGEPTESPYFFQAVKMAKEFGFGQIQAAHNGKNMAKWEFAKQAKEAGLHSIYLQFDGLSEDIYLKMRAERILDTKLQAIENARKLNLRVILVPTVVKGINDHQVGDIVKFAIENADVITGISFQPVCFTGRINERKRMEKRYTMTHLAMDVDSQTGGLVPARESWVSIGCTSPMSRLAEALTGEKAMTMTLHPDCGSGTYIFVEPEERKEAKVITDFFDFYGAIKDIDELATKLHGKNERTGKISEMSKLFTKAQALQILRKHFNPKKAPKGLTFQRMLGVMDGYANKEEGRAPGVESKTSYPTIFVAGMHFQDPYNYDVERVKRCIIHYSAKDGRIYPFCTYNSGPYYRERVEEGGGKALGAYKVGPYFSAKDFDAKDFIDGKKGAARTAVSLESLGKTESAN